jgi:ABC-type amino acid transport substrate-binding protein
MGSDRVLRRILTLLATIAALAAAMTTHAQVSEADLKAAFVYNFALFTEWPPDRLAAGQKLLICAPPDERQLEALRRLQAKTVGGHQIAVTAAAGEADRCHVVLYSRVLPAEAAAVDALTVCDGSRFACADAVITLLREGDRIRFDVDVTRAKARRLSLSSKLLRVARRVQ